MPDHCPQDVIQYGNRSNECPQQRLVVVIGEIELEEGVLFDLAKAECGEATIVAGDESDLVVCIVQKIL